MRRWCDYDGADGWQPDPVWFREETFGVGFDPLTYRIAVDFEESYVGLARVWCNPGQAPRLGMVGVLPAYRQRGLGRALIAQAFAALAERGVPLVTAEVDVTNTASNALMQSLGGVVTGGSVELFRCHSAGRAPTGSRAASLREATASRRVARAR